MVLLHKIDQLNKKMPANRDIGVIAMKAGEELGELCEAILCKGGHKSSKNYEDLEGITGEAVDLALCALSIALKESTLSEVEEVLEKKMGKWYDKTCKGSNGHNK